MIRRAVLLAQDKVSHQRAVAEHWTVFARLTVIAASLASSLLLVFKVALPIKLMPDTAMVSLILAVSMTTMTATVLIRRSIIIVRPPFRLRNFIISFCTVALPFVAASLYLAWAVGQMHAEVNSRSVPVIFLLLLSHPESVAAITALTWAWIQTLDLSANELPAANP